MVSSEPSQSVCAFRICRVVLVEACPSFLCMPKFKAASVVSMAISLTGRNNASVTECSAPVTWVIVGLDLASSLVQFETISDEGLVLSKSGPLDDGCIQDLQAPAAFHHDYLGIMITSSWSLKMAALSLY